MWITVDYINKYGFYAFDPFIKDLTAAKILYLQKLWYGCKAVRITVNSWSDDKKTIWETPVPVFPSYNNDNPTDDLPF